MFFNVLIGKQYQHSPGYWLKSISLFVVLSETVRDNLQNVISQNVFTFDTFYLAYYSIIKTDAETVKNYGYFILSFLLFSYNDFINDLLQCVLLNTKHRKLFQHFAHELHRQVVRAGYYPASWHLGWHEIPKLRRNNCSK